VIDECGVVSRGPSKCSTITWFVLDVANDGTLGHDGNRQNVTDVKLCFFTAIKKLARIHPLSSNEKLLLYSVSVGIPELDTNDEVLSDVYTISSAYSDVIMSCKSAYKSKEAVGNVDIGCGNAFGGSEEETGGEEGGSEKVLDVMYNFNLVIQPFSKADFMAFIKNYLKNLKAYLETNGQKDRSDVFQKGAQEFVKFVVSKFDDFTFYVGASEKMDGGLVFSFWEDESAAGPVFYYFKDGYKEQKC